MSEEKKLKKSRKDVDMTEGSISRHIINFAIPLIIGNLFQMLYNTVDTWVVGNFVSDEAFSAVGTVGPALNMVISFAIGLGAGGGVVISQYYGARQEDRVSDAVHTAMLSSVILGAILAVVGVISVPGILKLMKVPANIYPDAKTYLTLLYALMIPPVIYNIGAGVLRAVGDSTRPFHIMVVSTLTNIVLDLLFVIRFGWGVVGVAVATSIAQVISCILVLRIMLKETGPIRLVPSKLKIHTNMLRQIINIGIPAAIQGCITSFSNLFVQSYVNAFGSTVMGGWTAYQKVAQIIQLPIISITTALSTFVGQNLGKNYVDRAKQGVHTSLIINYSFCVVAGLGIYMIAPALSAFFNSNPEIVKMGAYFLRHIIPMYFLIATYQTLAAALRGAGQSKLPMIAMLAGGVGFRQLYLFVLTHMFPGNILPVTYAYPAGWAMAGLILLIYYNKVDLGRSRLVKD
ncbi:MAG: MATE family efflux transporter [Firmicutes bacterium]|nr:MATE family efflux transporter [Bacillota bacterium]